MTVDWLVADAEAQRSTVFFERSNGWPPGADRIGRNLRHLIGVLEELQQLGVAVISLRDGLDLSTAASVRSQCGRGGPLISHAAGMLMRLAQSIPGFVNPNNTGACDTTDVVAAIRYAADNGAKIINLSLGGPGPSPAYLDAIRYAVQRGAFVAMAMGNEYEDGNPVDYPAAYGPQVDGAIAVGAINRSRRRAFYSNTGSHIEITAPGGDERDGGLSGMVYQAGLYDPDFDPARVFIPRFDRYYEKPNQGTSMAAPHIAGIAALLYAQGITNPAAIEAAIKRFAIDLGPPGRDNEYGYGLVDARAALRGLGVAR